MTQPSISSLFPSARKILYDTRSQLAVLSTSNNPPSITSEILSSVSLSLSELSHRISLLRTLVNNEAPQAREIWVVKIESLSSDHSEMVNQMNQIEEKERASYNYRREREGLFGGGGAYRRDNMSAMGELAEEGASTDRSNRMVNEIIATGSATMDSLLTQRDRLKGVRRMVLDMGTLLGLSDSTMRLIERRDVVDRWIVVGGMMLTLFILFLLFGR